MSSVLFDHSLTYLIRSTQLVQLSLVIPLAPKSLTSASRSLGFQEGYNINYVGVGAVNLGPHSNTPASPTWPSPQPMLAFFKLVFKIEVMKVT